MAPSETTGWTEEGKLEFVTKFFYSQVQGKLDWKSASIPEGRTMNACSHLMRGLKAKYVTENDCNSGPAAPVKTKASRAAKPKAVKAKPASKKRKLAAADDDIEEPRDHSGESDKGVENLKEEDDDLFN